MSSYMPARYKSLLIAVLLTGSCRGEPNDLEALEAPPSSQISLVANAPYPGGGTSLLLRVTGPESEALTGDAAAVQVSGTGIVASKTESVSVSPGYTAIVLLPGGDGVSHASRKLALNQFIQSREPNERVAIFRWQESMQQLVGFTADREETVEILGWDTTVVSPSSVQSPTVGVLELLEKTSSVGGLWRETMRNIIFVGDTVPGIVPAFASTALAQWVVPLDQAVQLESVPAANLHLGEVGAGLNAAAAQINSLAQRGHVRVSLCGDPQGHQVELDIDGSDDGLSTWVAASLREERSMECDLDEIVNKERRYPDRIDLILTEAERSRYDMLAANNSKADFTLNVRWGARDPMTAVAHMRGKGSIGCERRNYTMNLDGKRPRHVMPNSGTDEFYLLSMCLDDRYIRQFTVLRAWKALGLFHSELRLIELTLDGETQAFYLLIEKVVEAVRDNNSGVLAILRRGFAPPDTTVEVKYARNQQNEAAVADYNLVEPALSGLSAAELITSADTHFNLDSYLRWLASNSILLNGDYVDEVWLMQSERLRKDGTIGGHYSFGGWDAEDIFGGCHYNGTHAFDDAWGLTYCAEAEWDQVLLADPIIYSRYVDILEERLDGGLDQEVFDLLLRDTEDQLSAIAARPGAAAALIRLINKVPGATDPDVASAEIRAAGAAMSVDFAERSALLRERISAYRGSGAR